MQLNFHTYFEERVFPSDTMKTGYKAFLKGKEFVGL